MVKFWLIVAGVWLGLSGLLFVVLLLVGFGVIEAIMGTAFVAGISWFLWSRDIPAKDLQMRESTWNTPED